MKKTLRLTESQLETLIERSLTEAKLKKANLLKKQPNKVNKTKAKEQFDDHYNVFTKKWMGDGVPAPNKEELYKQAEADGYQGRLKLQGNKNDLKNAKFIYLPGSNIKWKSGFEAGGTGGKTASGGV